MGCHWQSDSYASAHSNASLVKRGRMIKLCTFYWSINILTKYYFRRLLNTNKQIKWKTINLIKTYDNP